MRGDIEESERGKEGERREGELRVGGRGKERK